MQLGGEGQDELFWLRVVRVVTSKVSYSLVHGSDFNGSLSKLHPLREQVFMSHHLSYLRK